MTDARPQFTIYHNPDCGTSRNTLILLREGGVEPKVVEYRRTPPSREVIEGLAERIGFPLRDIMRRKGTPFADLALDNPAIGTDELLDAIAAHPILLNRPIVTSDARALLCRPSDVVLDLMAWQPAKRILKEDGSPFLKDRLISPSDPAFGAALVEAGLPGDDLMESNRRFYAYDMLDGMHAGYAGFEQYGEDVLIRSVVVPPEARKGDIGSGIVPLLLFRALKTGARRAYLITTSAAPFFARLGFKEVERKLAPASILSTRQATFLCPASAALMTRKLGF